MLKKALSKAWLIFLVLICLQTVINAQFAFAAAPEPSKLKIYVGPPKVPADNNVYEAIFVQLQDAKGVPARAKQDIDIHLSSSSTYVGSVDPVITIRAGETYAVAKFYSTYTPGSTTITATASGFATVQDTITTVGPVPYKLAVYTFPPVLAADNGIYNAIVVQLQDSGGTPAKAPIGDVQVTLSSSNTTVGTVDPYIVIEGGNTYAVANFYAKNSEGATTITAMASGYVSAQTTVKTQYFGGEPTKLTVYVGPPKVPAEGIVYNAVAVQLLDAKGKIAKANGDIVVALSSSNTAVGAVTESAIIPHNKTYTIVKFYSTYRSGSTSITAAAADLESDMETITTVGPVPSKLAVYCAPSSLPADNRQYNAVIVQLQDSGGTPAKDPVGNVTVDLFSSKPDVGTVNSPLVIPYGETYSITVFHSTPSSGTTDITAQTAGYSSAQAKITTYLIDEYALTVSVSAYPETVNSNEKSTIRILVKYNNVTPAPGATIKLASNKGGEFSSITDEKNGYYMAVFTAPKVNSKTIITITANASKTGYVSGKGNITIAVVPVIQMGSLRLYIKDQDGNPISGATVTSTVQPSGMSPVTATTDQNGLASFTDIMAGAYTFEISREGYETQSAQLNVNANQTVTLTIALTKSQALAQSSNILLIVGIAICAVAVGLIIVIIIKRRKKEFNSLDMVPPPSINKSKKSKYK